MEIEIVETDLSQHAWWFALLRGLLALSFGVLVLLKPDISLTVLVITWGAFAVVEGTMLLAAALLLSRERAPSWFVVLQGSLGIAAGVAAFAWPGLTAVALLYLVAGWFLFVGALELAEAVHLRRMLEGAWMLALRGLFALTIGVLLAAFPGAGIFALLVWVGVFSLLTGGVLVALSWRMRPRKSARAGRHVWFAQG